MIDINLEWKSEDIIEVESEEELKTALIGNGMNIFQECTFTSVENGNHNEKKFLISPSTEEVLKVKNLLKDGELKEKNYSDIRKNFEEQKQKIIISKEDMEKVLYNKVKKKDKLYFAILDKLIESIASKTINFIKEMKEIQSNILKIRNSSFFSFYYKIFNILYEDSISSIYDYSELFITSKQNILEFVEVYIKMVQGLAHEVNVAVLEKLKSNEIFAKYNKEIVFCLTFIEKNIQFLPVARYIGSSSHNFIFSAGEAPVNAHCSERTFEFINEIIEQFPSIDTMNDTFDEKNSDKEMLAMSCVRDFGIYNKFQHTKAYKLIYEFLLYFCD